MNIKLIDQLLDTTITGFLYGAELWLGCAIALYVINRQQKTTAPERALKPVNVEHDGGDDKENTVGKNASIAQSQVVDTEGAITIDITPSVITHAPASKASGIECLVVKAPVATFDSIAFGQLEPLQTKLLQRKNEPVTELKIKQSSIDFAMLSHTVVESDNSEITISLEEKSAKTDVAAASSEVAQPLKKKIACEPVVWKTWKVADLRRASVANACGVRTRCKDSRRNLPKAELIAQYEQSFSTRSKTP